MKMNYANIFRASVWVLMLSTMITACSVEDKYDPGITGDKSSLSLSFISDPMQRYKVQSRANYTKDDEEKKINRLYIFFFDEKGEYLKGGYLTGYKDAPEEGGYYTTGEGVTIIKIDATNFNEQQNPEKAIIYAVANVDPSMFDDKDGDGLPDNVKRLSDLEAMDFSLGIDNLSLGIPANGIPMVSKVEMNLATPDPNGNIVELQALMSRIDVNIKLESDITDNNFPSLTMIDWTAKNLPLKAPFTAPESGKQTGETWTGETWTKSITTPLQRTIYNKNGEINISFYMFENIQKAEWKVDEGEQWHDPSNMSPEGLYPTEILENSDKNYQKQRYKPYLANKNATAVEVHAFYSTYNEVAGQKGATYEVHYTLYLGANYTDNFEVKRNHKYENNITIKGLTQIGTNPEHITFDARVNVSKDENDYYIAMLRERNHDAHFCITPMDVYLFADGTDANPTMEVILGEVPEGQETPTNIPDWIRMEKIKASDMEAGSVTQSGFTEYVKGSSGSGTHLATHKPWFAGNGKRAFFTKNLLSELQETGKKVTIENTRDRVYFYLDENLQLQDRSAIVTLIYKENGTETSRRTIKIEQTHFLPITIEEKYDYNETSPDMAVWHTHYREITIYMEQYEEYLDHYDPLDEHRTEQIYNGLPWGCENINIPQQNIFLFRSWPINYYSDLECSHNWYLGLPYTNAIISAAGHNIMTLNDTPRSAAEYCYNRNKRNSDGTVSDGKYFLPGIRQMEKSLTQYYTKFNEFQSGFYWSSAASERIGGTSGQDTGFARATKITPDGSYIESGGRNDEYPKSGRAKRSEKLRIRAFRVDLEPMN